MRIIIPLLLDIASLRVMLTRNRVRNRFGCLESCIIFICLLLYFYNWIGWNWFFHYSLWSSDRPRRRFTLMLWTNMQIQRRGARIKLSTPTKRFWFFEEHGISSSFSQFLYLGLNPIIVDLRAFKCFIVFYFGKEEVWVHRNRIKIVPLLYFLLPE